MNMHDSDFDIELLPDPVKTLNEDQFRPRDAYQIRRTIERLAEIKQLRDLLGDPEFNDFE